MGWARFDPKRAVNRKLRKAGLEAAGLDAACICQSVADETDGFISDDTVEEIGLLYRCKHWAKVAQALVDVGRWARDEAKGGWWIHDFLEFNFSHAQMEEKRQKAKDNGKRGGEAKAKRNPGDPASGPLSAPLENGYRERSKTLSAPVTKKPSSVSVSEVAGGCTDFQSSSNLPKTDDDDPETAHRQAWEAAEIAHADRTTPANLAKLGPVHSRRHWMAVAYRNQLDDLARLAHEHIDALADELATAIYENPPEVNEIVSYLGQSRTIAQRTINHANNVRQAVHKTTDTCHTCHDRRLIDIGPDGQPAWCPQCRPGWKLGGQATAAQ